MKLEAHKFFKKAVALTALFCMTTQTTFAALLNLAPEPLAISQVSPKIMLAMTKDQQLYKKAYNDYSDLDGDGVAEQTYKHTVEYYGYFDPYKCYTYLNNRFEPTANTVIVVTANPRVVRPGLCAGAVWSGNFLNWVTMTRMDAVRKLLYGGMRSTDETFDAVSRPVPITVLERAFVPTDAHAWAKYYLPDGSDPINQPAINLVTPFNPPTSAAGVVYSTGSSVAMPTATGDISMTFSAAVSGALPGDQLRIERDNNANQQFTATITSVTNSNRTLSLRVHTAGIRGGSGSDDRWRVFNLTATGISFCNLTPGTTNTADANSRSSTNTNAPIIRVAQGNFSLWSSNEQWQCDWANARRNLQGGFAGGLLSNGNQAALSEINASAENPYQNTHGLGTGSAQGEFIVRVKVCDPKFYDAETNGESCRRYPNGNYKPAGLLQEYGEDGRFHFGLMTGSYAKNVSGGVLRKNPGTLADEVRASTDGAFMENGVYRSDLHRPAGGIRSQTSTQSPPGIINTLNFMRIYGYDYNGGGYLGARGDNCTYQLTSIAENQCTSWGNPMSEIFFEAVRYYAGNSASNAYTYSGGNSKDNELGLPLATWQQPLTTANYCANLNVLVFNASVSGNDDDLRSTSGAAINASSNIATLTDTVGNAQHENINGGNYFIGKLIGTTATNDPGFELCTGKNITGLGSASGICPEGPTTAGSYLIAGLANHAKTNRIRPASDPVAALVSPSDSVAMRVSTFGIQLASNTPQLEIRYGNGANERIVIQPIYRLNVGGQVGGGGLVDMRYVRLGQSGNTITGKVYVNWEDSEQGGDYDQDMWGTIEWTINTNTRRVTVTTNAVAASTANPQGFGYAVSGTTQDGPHFHSGIYGFNYTDPRGVLGCTNCQLPNSGGQSGPQSVTYNLSATPPADSLQDPLWYAAKYGGFVDTNGNGRPDLQSEWDRENNSTGAAGADGIPDNYFYVTNPIQLVTSLGRALRAIGTDSSGTAVMANSTSLSTTNRIYQARYNPNDWSGQLLARDVGATGTISGAVWDAGRLLNNVTATSRTIMTYDNVVTKDGVAFRSGSIPASLLALLHINPTTGLSDLGGANRVDYLRGDTNREIRNGGSYRNRTNSVLGDIANSDPTYVGPPNLSRPEANYSTFRDANYSRRAMLYVGANDGMLHGFDAVTGAERMAYIPSKTFPHLTTLTSPLYSHRYFVDAPPEASDAVVNGGWKTVLVGGLGGGGQGLYALDVTDPNQFSEANANRTVLWEFNDTDNADLGYVYGKPVIRQMANGRWAAVVTGGYNTSQADAAIGTGRASLFIIFLDGPSGPGRTWIQGTDYIKIDTGVGDLVTPNGLAPPFVTDVDGNLVADFVYAGDLRGNFWKFDLRSTNPATWAAATSRVVLFQAKDGNGNAQPITAQAEGTFHPTGQGYLLTFGTGKYLEVADTLPPFNTQSFYGIWDRNNTAQVSSQTVVANRSALLDQTITEVSATERTLPRTGPDWQTQSGWYIDFPRSNATGERAVFRPIIVSGRLIFTTLVPVGDACAGGGTSFLMIMDPVTGGQASAAVFDSNRDNVLTASDKLPSGDYISGLKSDVGISPTPVIVKGGPTQSSATSTDKTYGRRNPTVVGSQSAMGYTFMGGPLGITGMWIGLTATSGRVSWREIITP